MASPKGGPTILDEIASKLADIDEALERERLMLEAGHLAIARHREAKRRDKPKPDNADR